MNTHATFVNKCIICGLEFDHWVLYIEHEALVHTHPKCQEAVILLTNSPIPSQNPFEEDMPLESNPRPILAHSSGRSDLAKQEWKGYMPKQEKERIVNAFEAKLAKGVLINHE